MGTRSVGRPVKYRGRVATYIAGMVRRLGALNAVTVLTASSNAKPSHFTGSREAVAEAVELNHRLAHARNQNLVPHDKPLTITLPTAIKIARNAGIVLERGRRSGKAENLDMFATREARKQSKKVSAEPAAA